MEISKSALASRLETCFRLGVGNVLTVVLYRLLKQVGYYRRRLPVGRPIEGELFSGEVATPGGEVAVQYFACHPFSLPSPPDWFTNPWTGRRFADTSRHWSEISDFIPELGDIKTVWELSRFDWLFRQARKYRDGDRKARERIELWLRDWCRKNPTNGGVNWKCGQEAALRCLNLLAAASAIDDSFERPRDGILRFLDLHLERISATCRYAMAQDNNHGVSEAAALFVAGSYLERHGGGRRRKAGRRWAWRGRVWLENRVERLVLDDGSFSQYSLTYHRMVVDLLAFVELFRRRLKLSPFSPAFYEKARRAVRWLHCLVDIESGDGPNLGSNDGTCLFNGRGLPYRDFRPGLQLGAAVFLERNIPGCDRPHPLLELFGIRVEAMARLSDPDSTLMADGGYAVLRNGPGFALLRLPVYRFRPGHADALHLDIWHEGINWCRDAGSYSYNTEPELLNYFPGTRAHNTVAFDDRDQMPRLGRFLFGAWLRPDELEWRPDEGFVRSGYTDYRGARHVREVKRHEHGWQVIDTMSGFTKKAVIRWHLAKADWKLEGTVLSCDKVELAVKSAGRLELALLEMPESLHYLQKQLVPVLEIRCHTAGMVITTITFKESASK